MTVVKCKSCGATIFFIKTKTGKSMPVDAEPSPTGNIRLTETGGEVLGKKAAEEARLNGTPLYLSHYATCPDAAKYRKRHFSHGDYQKGKHPQGD